jgi:hypothetical protein
MMNLDYLGRYLPHRDLLKKLDLVSVSYNQVSLKPWFLRYSKVFEIYTDASSRLVFILCGLKSIKKIPLWY